MCDFKEMREKLESYKCVVNVSASWSLAIAIVLAYVFKGVFWPWSIESFYLTLLVAGLVYFLVYRDEKVSFKVDGIDLVFLAGSFLLMLFTHLSGVFQPLGGDELYHSERAVHVLTILKQYAASLPYLTIADYRNGLPWGLFDIRHLQVLDVWRIVSLLFWVLVLGGVCVYKALPSKYRPLARVFGLVVLVLAGLCLHADPEVHPPLRIWPWCLSALFFGLNAFAFRLPALLSVCLASFVLFKYLRERSETSGGIGELALYSCLSAFLPVTFYVSDLVEASAYAYLTGVVTLILVLRYLESKEDQPLVLAGLVVGLGALFRQTSIYYWPLIGLVFLMRIKEQSLKSAVRIFSPAVLVLPYLWSVHVAGHGAEVDEGALIPKLYRSLSSGASIMSIANNANFAWLALCVLALVLILIRGKGREKVLLLGFIPGYIMFYTVWSYLWGLGRYQAEYVGTFFAYLLILLPVYLSPKVKKFMPAVAIFLVVLTLDLNDKRSLDINYLHWPQMRLSSQANFPYMEAFKFLKRAESGGGFVWLGGSPIYGPMSLWLAGFSYTESDRWEKLKLGSDALVQEGKGVLDLADYLNAANAKYLVLQTGTRREDQHRPPHLRALIESFEVASKETRRTFEKQTSFISDHGGVLTIYRLRSLAHG